MSLEEIIMSHWNQNEVIIEYYEDELTIYFDYLKRELVSEIKKELVQILASESIGYLAFGSHGERGMFASGYVNVLNIHITNHLN